MFGPLSRGILTSGRKRKTDSGKLVLLLIVEKHSNDKGEKVASIQRWQAAIIGQPAGPPRLLRPPAGGLCRGPAGHLVRSFHGFNVLGLPPASEIGLLR